MSTPATIPMFDPQGTLRDIPYERMNEARQNGAVIGVRMQAPDGTTRIVPANRMQEAIGHGGKVLPIEQQAAQHEGFLSAIGSDLFQMAKSAPKAILQAPGSPGSILQLPEKIQQVRDEYASIKETGKTLEQRQAEQREQQGYSPLYSRISAPLAQGAGVNVQGMEQSAQRGDVGGVLGHAAAVPIATAAMEGVGRVAQGVGRVAPLPTRGITAPLRGALEQRLAEVPAGETLSRGQTLDAARQHGVNLDIAQATGSPTAQVLKKGNRYSIASEGIYKTNAARNIKALEDWASSVENSHAPNSPEREVLGGQIQNTLRQDLQARKASAAEAFKDLDERVGGNLIDGTATVEAEARSIVSEMKDYYAKHPELKPKQAWSIVENLAERPKVNTVNPEATAPGLMDARGEPVTATGTITKQPAQAHTFTWSELHQLRSDLMDVYRNNPDLIKGRSEAWLQRMVGTIDNAMTQSAGGLSGKDLAEFRRANAEWEAVKQTYDDPQSPLYHAVRAQFPSQVTDMLSQGARPELARQVRQVLGDLEGPFQRSFIEKLLTEKDGTLALGKLSGKLKRIPKDHLQEMVGFKTASELENLASVAKRVFSDENPSGTAKVGQPAAEIGILATHPVAGLADLAGQFAIAKAINSPRMVDYLTRSGIEPKRAVLRPTEVIPNSDFNGFDVGVRVEKRDFPGAKRR